MTIKTCHLILHACMLGTRPGTKETILQARQANGWQGDLVLPPGRAGVNFDQGSVGPEIVI